MQAIFENYTQRLSRYTPFEYRNIKPVKAATVAAQLQSDAAMLLKKSVEGELLILLDERGKEMSSTELADFLMVKMNAATRTICFVIGGAYGFDQSVYNRSHDLIALSKFTLPHQLAKILLAEQLYRAFTIMRNEKYHHGD